MSITQYINHSETLSKMDFITAYATISELLKDGLITWEQFKNVCAVQS